MKVEDLDSIAIKVSMRHYTNHRDVFLMSMARAWLRADRFTKRMMRPAWEALCAKHQLTAT